MRTRQLYYNAALKESIRSTLLKKMEQQMGAMGKRLPFPMPFQLRGNHLFRIIGPEQVKVCYSSIRPQQNDNPYVRQRVSFMQKAAVKDLIKVPSMGIPDIDNSLLAMSENMLLDQKNPLGLPVLQPLLVRVVLEEGGAGLMAELVEQLGSLQLVGVRWKLEGEWSPYDNLLSRREQQQVLQQVEEKGVDSRVLLNVKVLAVLKWQAEFLSYLRRVTDSI